MPLKSWVEVFAVGLVKASKKSEILCNIVVEIKLVRQGQPLACAGIEFNAIVVRVE